MEKLLLLSHRKWRIGLACGAGAAIAQMGMRATSQHLGTLATALATMGLGGVISMGIYIVLESFAEARRSRNSQPTT